MGDNVRSQTIDSTRSVQRSALRVLRFALLLAALLLTACGGPSSAAEQKTVDGLTIGLERPRKIALLENHELVVTLTDASGQPVDGATVFLEQDMPAMPMKSNQPLGEPAGGGKYRITNAFTMEGNWILKIHATVAGKEHVATFEQKVDPS